MHESTQKKLDIDREKLNLIDTGIEQLESASGLLGRFVSEIEGFANGVEINLTFYSATFLNLRDAFIALRNHDIPTTLAFSSAAFVCFTTATTNYDHEYFKVDNGKMRMIIEDLVSRDWDTAIVNIPEVCRDFKVTSLKELISDDRWQKLERDRSCMD